MDSISIGGDSERLIGVRTREAIVCDGLIGVEGSSSTEHGANDETPVLTGTSVNVLAVTNGGVIEGGAAKEFIEGGTAEEVRPDDVKGSATEGVTPDGAREESKWK